MSKLRLGLIGAGIAARDLHGPVIKALSDRYQVVAICSRTLEKARSLADWYGGEMGIYADYQEMLLRESVDAAVVAVPIALNLPVTRACVKAGLHVFLEKPIGANLKEGEEVLALAERRAVTLFIAENYRFRPDLRLARRLVEEGNIGRLGLIRWNDVRLMRPDNKSVQTPWRRNPIHIGGFLSDAGVHVAAGMRLLGGPVNRVQAVSTTMQPYLGGQDTLLINLTFASGAIGQITFCRGGLDYEARCPRLYGDRGTLVVDRDHVDVWQHDGVRRAEPVTGLDDFTAEFIAFHESVVQGDTSPDSAQEAFKDLLLIDAAIRGAASGATVEI